jgi:hypothetical protein
MAHNPHAQQGSPEQQQYDPAGNTQMFQAFVNETPEPPQRAGSNRTRMISIAAVVVSIAVLVAIVWL